MSTVATPEPRRQSAFWGWPSPASWDGVVAVACNSGAEVNLLINNTAAAALRRCFFKHLARRFSSFIRDVPGHLKIFKGGYDSEHFMLLLAYLLNTDALFCCIARMSGMFPGYHLTRRRK